MFHDDKLWSYDQMVVSGAFPNFIRLSKIPNFVRFVKIV